MFPGDDRRSGRSRPAEEGGSSDRRFSPAMPRGMVAEELRVSRQGNLGTEAIPEAREGRIPSVRKDALPWFSGDLEQSWSDLWFGHASLCLERPTESGGQRRLSAKTAACPTRTTLTAGRFDLAASAGGGNSAAGGDDQFFASVRRWPRTLKSGRGSWKPGPLVIKPAPRGRRVFLCLGSQPLEKDLRSESTFDSTVYSVENDLLREPGTRGARRAGF